MVSPKGSSKHLLVTYNSDVSDGEHEPIAPIDTLNDISDLMSISPATMESSGPSPREEEVPKKKLKKNTSSNSMKGLVSYGMDDDESADEEEEEEEEDVEEEEPESRDNTQKDNSFPTVDNEEMFNNDSRDSSADSDDEKKPENELKSHSGVSSSKVKAAVVTERPTAVGGAELPYVLSRQIYNNHRDASGDICVPPPSTVRPSAELAARIEELRAKALNSRCSPTETILKNKAYRNPSIYEKLIQHMKIDERGTNYPPELYDPYRFGEESYYEVLARQQDQAERRRLQQEGTHDGAGAVPGGSRVPSKSSAVTGVGVRKSKWDTTQGGAVRTTSTYSSATNTTTTIETRVIYPSSASAH